ncbi:hypothetical protein AVL50_08345 [Flammeovirga sp. SJP92]|nr:hypothetical protein AVL50_08345 [Flammeovirga sp. SJP92]
MLIKFELFFSTKIQSKLKRITDYIKCILNKSLLKFKIKINTSHTLKSSSNVLRIIKDKKKRSIFISNKAFSSIKFFN